MKSLQDILNESTKTYSFKIGIAGELPNNFESKLKSMLEKFSVVSLSKGKKTPIQEKPMDFPQLNNTEITYWEAVVKYPTTEYVLKEYLGQTCDVHYSKIIVKNPLKNDDQIEKESVKIYEPLLTKEKLESESAQSIAGEQRVMSLLKELEKEKKERNFTSFKIETSKTLQNISAGDKHG